MAASPAYVQEDDIVVALRGMREVEGVRACEFILNYDEYGDCVVNVALILEADTWTDAAARACELARSAAWDGPRISFAPESFGQRSLK